MSADHLESILSAGGAEAMVAATYHDYQDECVDDYAKNATAAGLVMNVSCMDVAMMVAVSRYGPSTYSGQYWYIIMLPVYNYRLLL